MLPDYDTVTNSCLEGSTLSAKALALKVLASSQNLLVVDLPRAMPGVLPVGQAQAELRKAQAQADYSK